MAILVHHRAFDQETPHEAARAALSQADLWGSAEALGLEIVSDLSDDNRGMDLYISGPLHHVMDLYDTAVTLGTQAEISRIEVDSDHDLETIRRHLPHDLKVFYPQKRPA